MANGLIPLPHRFLFQRKQDLPTGNTNNRKESKALDMRAIGTYILPSPDWSLSGRVTPFQTFEEWVNNLWLKGDTRPLGVAWGI